MRSRAENLLRHRSISRVASDQLLVAAPPVDLAGAKAKVAVGSVVRLVVAVLRVAGEAVDFWPVAACSSARITSPPALPLAVRRSTPLRMNCVQGQGSERQTTR